MTRIPEQPVIASQDPQIRATLTPILGEHAREINRTMPADQVQAFNFLMS